MSEEIDRIGDEAWRAIRYRMTVNENASLQMPAAVFSQADRGEASKVIAAYRAALQRLEKASAKKSFKQIQDARKRVCRSFSARFVATVRATRNFKEPDVARCKDEQQEAQKKAQELERQRDEKTVKADHLIHQHHYFAYTVSLL
ncbi:hypothetical protein [Mesorhizobium sp. KR1-2]|uniref:hypothetical protein n=1 Tax=Mesorhizobium sp. KR1-2 TaxID=3156609 RepID=UPI0032B43B51